MNHEGEPVAIFNAIRAATADHEYDEGEMKSIRHPAQRLGIDEHVIPELEALQWDEEH